LVKNFAESLRQGCIDGWVGKGDSAGNANDGSGGCAKPYADLKNRVKGDFAAQDISSSAEDRTEFYVRGDFAFDDLAVPVKGNLGLRYVGYQLESTGFLVLPPETARGGGSLASVIQTKYPSIYALANGTTTQSTVDGTDYNTVLPSLNLTFSLTDEVIARFAVSKGLYYPSLLDTRNSMLVNLDYTQVLQDPTKARNDATNPVVDIKDIEISATARNAYLEPEESVNVDVTTEWYFAKAGSVSVGLFQKKIDNIIRNHSFNLDIETGGNEYPVSAYGPANTGSGTIHGVELSYSQFYDFLPGAWSGLGLQLNYTYISQSGLEDPNQASADLQFTPGGAPISDNRNSFRMFTNLPLEGYSDKNLNIVGMYEYKDISFRLAYTWRSEYLLTLRESEEFVPTYAEASGMMDASLYYTINEHVKVGIEGSNLLAADTKTKYQLDQYGHQTDALSFTTDRRYALSVRATF
jgi:TonB-dependent receptor